MQTARRFLGYTCFILLIGCISPYRIAHRGIFDESNLINARIDTYVIQPPAPRLPEKETLVYQVKWTGIPVGILTASIKGIEKIRGRDAYVFEVTMKTNAFLSMIYRVNDRFVSYMDVEKRYSLRSEVYRREGGYKKDAVIDFDQENHKAHFKNLLDKSEFDFDIPEAVHDVVSAFYYFTLLPVKVGDAPELFICNSEKNYHVFGSINMTLLMRVPTLNNQDKEAFLMQPYAELDGERVEKGSGSVYYSCEPRSLPLLAVLKAPVFTQLTISLIKVENPDREP
jgi:hypothetical protein